MPTSTRAKRRTPPSRRARTGATTRTGKVRKAFWLDPQLLEEARESFGAATEREAVEMAAAARKFVLDTSCFIDASRTDVGANAFAEFCARAAPRLT